MLKGGKMSVARITTLNFKSKEVRTKLKKLIKIAHQQNLQKQSNY